MGIDNLESLRQSTVLALKISCPIYGAFMLRNRLENMLITDFGNSQRQAAVLATIGAGSFELAKAGIVLCAYLLYSYS